MINWIMLALLVVALGLAIWGLVRSSKLRDVKDRLAGTKMLKDQFERELDWVRQYREDDRKERTKAVTACRFLMEESEDALSQLEGWEGCSIWERIERVAAMAAEKASRNSDLEVFNNAKRKSS